MKNDKRARVAIEHEGVPAHLTLEEAKVWVRPRVSEKRFNHIAGVAKVARELAERVDQDPFPAELASWLHDACKETKDKELVRQAKTFGINLNAVEEANGHLLHGPVAAETVRQDLGLTNELVLNAMREHTLGAVQMTELSKIVFLADCLEEGRPQEYTAPIWLSLNEGFETKEGRKLPHTLEIDLDAAILTAIDLGLKHLLDTRRVIHPKTIDVRNYTLALLRVRDE